MSKTIDQQTMEQLASGTPALTLPPGGVALTPPPGTDIVVRHGADGRLTLQLEAQGKPAGGSLLLKPL